MYIVYDINVLFCVLLYKNIKGSNTQHIRAINVLCKINTKILVHAPFDEYLENYGENLKIYIL